MDKKIDRVLWLYTRMMAEKPLVKQEEARRCEVNERTIQRDLEDIRAFLANHQELDTKLVYDRAKKAYVLVRGDEA